MAKSIGRNGELFSVLCDPAHLIRSARAAARGKKKRPDAARFLLDMEPECFRLADQLASGEWMPGSYQTFTIREPKPRLISAAPFRDRVVHHAIVSILEPHFERRFVAHSYACRKGKGTHRALDRAAELSRKRKFVLKGDLSKFFPSIDHEILKGEVRRVIADEQLLAVLERIIDGSNPQEPVWEWFAGDDLFTPCARRRRVVQRVVRRAFLLPRLQHAGQRVQLPRFPCRAVPLIIPFTLFPPSFTFLVERLLGSPTSKLSAAMRRRNNSAHRGGLVFGHVRALPAASARLAPAHSPPRDCG